MSAPTWFSLDPGEVELRLETSADRGLDEHEADRRRIMHGRNEVAAVAERPWWPLLVKQFASPLTLILIAAVTISAGLGESVDAVVIGAIVMVNSVLGFVQERRAGQAIDALTSMLVLDATVVRGGKRSEIDAAELVPGDVVEVAAGDRVPADLRVIDSTRLSVDESALTGEPHAIHKSPDTVGIDAALSARACLLHAGTDVTTGHGRGIVVATGATTEFGTVVDLAAGAEQTEIPLQRSLGALGRLLGFVAMAIAVLTVLAGALAGRPSSEMLITGISLAVAIVPEGLPAVVTVTLALGIQAMSKRRALLRHLEAAETLGAASVICTDKTGTLTQNIMRVRRIWNSEGLRHVGPESPKRSASSAPELVDALVHSAQVCNRASLNEGAEGPEEIGDPTESALLVLARELGQPRPTDEVLHEIPFDSTTKFMAVVARSTQHGLLTHVKGAPEVVLAMSSHWLTSAGPRPLTPTICSDILTAQHEMMTAGLRTLAVAHRPIDEAEIEDPVPGRLVFLGLVGLHDPPRPEVAEAVRTALDAGITIVVMTGDARGTGLSIAAEVGLPATKAIVGSELEASTDAELFGQLDGSTVLARVTPAHKMRVIQVLQDRGAVVAMTGDGVNDAPALEQASIGIAMGLRGTDVARQAADAVLADDNFASIVAAVDEGRRQYANIRKFIRYLLSSNLGEVIAITGSVLLGWPLILLPAQILWMNLLTDGVTALALGVEPTEPDAMTQPPRDPDEPIVDRVGAAWIGGMGLLIGLTTLFVFRLSLGTGEGADLVRAQTLAFTAMVLMEKMNVFNFRSEREPIHRVGVLTNRWLALAWSGAIAAQIAAVHLPGLSDALGTTALSLSEWVSLVLVALPVLGAGELVKLLRRRTHRRTRAGGTSDSVA